MSKYIIVLFKNKKKRKIIKRYSTEKTAISFFKKLVKENKKIVFDKKIENATHVNYHIGLLTNQSNVQHTLHFVDDLGRNHVANLEDKDYVFIDIQKYNVEEKIYDYQLKDKINFSKFLINYCSNKHFFIEQ